MGLLENVYVRSGNLYISILLRSQHFCPTFFCPKLIAWKSVHHIYIFSCKFGPSENLLSPKWRQTHVHISIKIILFLLVSRAHCLSLMFSCIWIDGNDHGRRVQWQRKNGSPCLSRFSFFAFVIIFYCLF